MLGEGQEGDQSRTWKTAMKIMTYFEAKYACSGICTPAYWFFSLSVDLGLPKETCLGYLKSEIGEDMMYLGVTSLLIGCVLFLLWCLQYCLWQQFKN